ncbi:SDR family NAD(P)-dependent oxidoreductase [Dongia sp.]|uniref:SDR family NAD(P)-dependent oxidoreductase n=1 Tax=Dongia sp. TaxID=1977262 RepID=UPI0035AF24C0
MSAIFDLHGEVAVITGAAGDLGRHFARVLAEAGAAVALIGRRGNLVAEEAERMRAFGYRAIGIGADVTEALAIAAAFDEAEGELGPLSLLVNNAGRALTLPAIEIEEADWDDILDTNLKGAWLASRAMAKRWIAAKRPGNIVNIASILGLRVTGQAMPYSVSKAGLIQMTQALSLEWARHSIRLNALAPGYVLTDINRDFFATEAGGALLKRIPQRRLGTLDDLTGPLLLLASRASAYMTGSVLTVDGGHLNSGL